MHKYRLIAKKGEGTFSEVLKAQLTTNGKYLAVKCMKNHFESMEQVNALREIQALKRLSPHPHVVHLYEVLFDPPTGRLALVFELMDMNIYELIRGRRHALPEQRVKRYIYQLLRAIAHMHSNGIFHRDIKPENILVSDETLKVADFGSCRGVFSTQPYTEYISTRWYRAPECLLTDGYYDKAMDMWGVGCVTFEVLALFPIFPGSNELDQIAKIHEVLGTPPEHVLDKMRRRGSAHRHLSYQAKHGSGIASLIPHASGAAVDLIEQLLAYDPDDRIDANTALEHAWFEDLREEALRLQRGRSMGHGLQSPRLASARTPRADESPLSRRKGRHVGTGSGVLAHGLPSLTGKGVDSGQGPLGTYGGAPTGLRHVSTKAGGGREAYDASYLPPIGGIARRADRDGQVGGSRRRNGAAVAPPPIDLPPGRDRHDRSQRGRSLDHSRVVGTLRRGDPTVEGQGRREGRGRRKKAQRSKRVSVRDVAADAIARYRPRFGRR